MRCSLVSGKLTSPVWQSTFYLVQNLVTLLQQCRRELHILVETPAGGGALGRDISRQRWERCFDLSKSWAAWTSWRLALSKSGRRVPQWELNPWRVVARIALVTSLQNLCWPPINFYHALFDLPYTAPKRREKLLTINYWLLIINF